MKIEFKIRQISKTDIILQKEFISVYQQVFAGEPYNEKWSDKEVQDMLNGWFSCKNNCVLVAIIKDKVVGIAVGIPLIYRKDLCDFFEKNNFIHNYSEYFYNAEVAVLNEFRGRGIASNLIKRRIEFAKKLNFVNIIYRTISKGSMSEPLYRKLGFNRIPNLFQYAKNNSISGGVVEYTDVFLTKKIINN